MNRMKKWWTEKFDRVRSTELLSKTSLLIPMTEKKKEHWVDIKITRVDKVLGHFYSVDTLSGHYTGKELQDALFNALIGECENVIKLTSGADSIIRK